MLDRLVDLVAKGMDALGLNGTRLRWRWSQRRLEMGERGLRASLLLRSTRGKHKMCPSCRALVPRLSGRCPECGTSMAGVRAPGITRLVANVFPGATMATSLILLTNGFWFALTLVAILREGSGGGLLFFTGDANPILLRFGMLYSGWVDGPSDWWRLIPPIFLHGGLLHFFFNSYVFLQLAPTVEEEYGTERFFVVYLVSGVAGFLASVLWDLFMGRPGPPTLGASGAVLGLMGLLIGYGIRRGGAAGDRIKNSILRYVFFIFAITILMRGGVNHLAHIGGLAAGFLLGMTLSWGPFRSRRQAKFWEVTAVICILAVVYAFYRVAAMQLGF